MWEDRGSQQQPRPTTTDDQLESDAELGPVEPSPAHDSEQPDADLQIQQDQLRQTSGARASTRRPVWEDPADAEKQVEVAGRNRLRKLRQTEEEQHLSGE